MAATSKCILSIHAKHSAAIVIKQLCLNILHLFVIYTILCFVNDHTSCHIEDNYKRWQQKKFNDPAENEVQKVLRDYIMGVMNWKFI